MKRFATLLSVLLCLSFVMGSCKKKDATVAASQPAASQPASQPAASQPAAEVVDTKLVKETADNVKDVIASSKTVAKGVDAQATKVPKLLAIMGLLAAVFKLLLSFLKWLSKWWVTKTGKMVLRTVTLVLGVATFFVTSMAMGEPWYNSLLLALSGPGSLALHEISQLVPGVNTKKKAKEAKVAAKATTLPEVVVPVVEPPKAA